MMATKMVPCAEFVSSDSVQWCTFGFPNGAPTSAVLTAKSKDKLPELYVLPHFPKVPSLHQNLHRKRKHELQTDMHSIMLSRTGTIVSYKQPTCSDIHSRHTC